MEGGIAYGGTGSIVFIFFSKGIFTRGSEGLGCGNELVGG